MLQQGAVWQVRYVQVCRGLLRRVAHGVAGRARCVQLRCGMVRTGALMQGAGWQAWFVKAWYIPDWMGVEC